MRRLAVLSSGLLLAGCTLFTDFDGLSDGANTGDPVDDPTTNATDASGDGARPDGSATSSGGDAALLPDGARAPFCETVPSSVEVCFDYDSRSYGGNLRMRNSTLSASTPGRDSDQSLLCVGASDSEIECYHTVAVSPNPKRLRYAFDVLPDANGKMTEVTQLRFYYDASGTCSIQPTIADGKLLVNEFCQSLGEPQQRNHEIADLESKTAWYRFDVSLDFTARTLNVTIDRPSGPVSKSIPLDARFVTAPVVELQPGLIYAPKATPGPSVRTDNVLLDVLE